MSDAAAGRLTRARVDPRLGADVRRAGLRQSLLAAGLAAPLALLVFLSFFVPILALLTRAFYDPTIADNLPRTAIALHDWDSHGLPDDTAFRAFSSDLARSLSQGQIYELAKSLNFRLPGARSRVLRAARPASRAVGGLSRQELIAIDPSWSEPATWRAIARGLHPFTAYYLLNALDLRPTPGGLAFVPPDQAIYLRIFGRTFLVAGIVTLATLIAAFPLAWLAAHVRHVSLRC